MSKQNSVCTFVWFSDEPKEVAAHYKRIFKSEYELVGKHSSDNQSSSAMEFNLAGHRLIAFKADGASKFTPAISFMITCRDQKAIDKYWDRFLAEGGKAGQCGWLTDKYGISWQVVPKNLPKLLKHKTDEGTKFLMETFLKMKKIEISALTYKAK